MRDPGRSLMWECKVLYIVYRVEMNSECLVIKTSLAGKWLVGKWRQHWGWGLL